MRVYVCACLLAAALSFRPYSIIVHNCSCGGNVKTCYIQYEGIHCVQLNRSLSDIQMTAGCRKTSLRCHLLPSPRRCSKLLLKQDRISCLSNRTCLFPIKVGVKDTLSLLI